MLLISSSSTYSIRTNKRTSGVFANVLFIVFLSPTAAINTRAILQTSAFKVAPHLAPSNRDAEQHIREDYLYNLRCAKSHVTCIDSLAPSPCMCDYISCSLLGCAFGERQADGWHSEESPRVIGTFSVCDSQYYIGMWEVGSCPVSKHPRQVCQK